MLATGLAAVLIGSLACGNPQKRLESGPVGANASAHTMEVLNAYVEPPKGSAYHPGEDAIVFFTLYNNADVPDELRSVETSKATEVRIKWDADCDGSAEPAAFLPVHPNGTVPEPPEGGPGTAYHLELFGLEEEVREGTTIPLVFTFEKAGELTVDAVVPPEESFEAPPKGCEPGVVTETPTETTETATTEPTEVPDSPEPEGTP
ncbi:copper(I)-binding protein [Prauserella shujinwangii]|uniref:Copper(I)-binding protein n=2 Tax=Prauserella shujinwangii TaxID=1453103 RepID=A0A2T0LL84_9PSEU|nr:copper(I)-binding protein [Prauserella shujinwangii]